MRAEKRGARRGGSGAPGRGSIVVVVVVGGMIAAAAAALGRLTTRTVDRGLARGASTSHLVAAMATIQGFLARGLGPAVLDAAAVRFPFLVVVGGAGRFSLLMLVGRGRQGSRVRGPATMRPLWLVGRTPLGMR